MTTKTLRLSDSLAAAVREIGTAEHVKESTAMRKLLRMGYDLYVAQQYRSERNRPRTPNGNRGRDCESEYLATAIGTRARPR